MVFTASEIGYGGLAPALTALIVCWLWHREAPRQAAALAVGSGFIVGFVLLNSGPIPSKSVWKWLPHIAALTMLAAPAIQGRLVVAIPACLAVAGVIAHVLIPERLADMRGVYLPVLGGAIAALWLTLARLPARINHSAFALMLFVVATSGAVVLVQSGNARYAQHAGLVAAATLGCFLVSALRGAVLQGLLVPFVALISGLMFLGYVYSYSEVPLASYALVPVAPVMLWLSAIRPITSWNGKLRLIVQVVLVLIPLAVSLGLALRADPPWLDDGY